MLKKIKFFLLSVLYEYSKVVWPTKKEILNMTVLVVYIVLFFSVYIGVVDYFLTRFVEILLRYR